MNNRAKFLFLILTLLSFFSLHTAQAGEFFLNNEQSLSFGIWVDI